MADFAWFQHLSCSILKRIIIYSSSDLRDITGKLSKLCSTQAAPRKNKINMVPCRHILAFIIESDEPIESEANTVVQQTGGLLGTKWLWFKRYLSLFFTNL